MEKMNQRQRQAIETRLNITRIATNLFKRDGFNDVTIRDICREASISVGTFYYHFSSKEEIVDTGHEQVDILVAEEIAHYESVGIAEDILNIFSIAGDLLQELGWLLSAHSYSQILSSRGSYTLRRDRPVFQFVEEKIYQGLEEGVFQKGLDPVEATETLMRISRGVLLDWCLREGSYTLSRGMRKDLELVLNSMISN